MDLTKNNAGKFSYIVLIAGMLALTYYISKDWYQLSLIRGESMNPAFRDMQFVIIDKHSDVYTYGDVIVFRCSELDSVLIKRVVACPGDQVEIRDETLYINDVISSVFSQEGVFEYAGIAENSVCLEDGEYFVIGDNLEQSKDSRYAEVGCVRADDIIGRVIGK